MVDNREPVLTFTFMPFLNQDRGAAETLADMIRKQHPDALRVVVLSQQQSQHDAIHSIRHSRLVVPLLSSAFIQTPGCLDIYNAASVCALYANRALLIPVCLEPAEFPSYMRMIQYLEASTPDAMAQVSFFFFC